MKILITYLVSLIFLSLFHLTTYFYSKDIILLEGRGLKNCYFKKSTLEDIQREFGIPDSFRSNHSKSENIVYSMYGLKFNICADKLNTIITLNTFKGKTSKGISLDSSLEDVERIYGTPKLESSKNKNDSKYWIYPKEGIVFWLDNSKSSNNKRCIKKIVICSKKTGEVFKK
ncbi:MAG: DUF4309 domain-containing protein [Candidatus Aureabacteria bacterium]|nr:DUF4309 domain-containing protein [Candidatus Auribacterota bacterium]